MFEPDEIGKLDRVLWDRQFAVNLRAPVFLAEAFAAQARAGAERVDRQHSRSARAEADAAVRLLCAGEKRAAHTRPACWRRRSRRMCASTRSRLGRHSRARASSRRISPPKPPQCRLATVRRRRRSPRLWCSWRGAQRHRADARGRWRPAHRVADPRRGRRRIVGRIRVGSGGTHATSRARGDVMARSTTGAASCAHDGCGRSRWRRSTGPPWLKASMRTAARRPGRCCRPRTARRSPRATRAMRSSAAA